MILVLVIVCPSLRLNAGQEGPSGVVREIVFVGNDRTPSDTIKSTIRTVVGRSLDVNVVDQDIKALYKLGQFRDIAVDSRPGRGGLVVTYNFVERPLIAEIGFDGNRKIKDDDLREDVTQRIYAALDDKSVSESIEKIKEAYAKKGYYLSDVSYSLAATDKGETKLVFEVRENARVAVRRIMFIGNKVFGDNELRDAIKTRQKGALSFLTGSGKYEEETLRNDVLFLTYFYLNHGYLKVRVAPPKTTISKDKRYIFVTFQVHEGSQYKIGRVDVTGDILTTKDELIKQLQIKTGRIYSQKTLDGDLVDLTDRYGDEGYAFASIVPRTVPDDETLTADIDINIAKGRQVTVERINIFGNTTTRDKVIRRELEIKEDDRYSERLMRRSREKLTKLGYFEEVNFATPRGSGDDKVVLNITVKEKTTGSFNIGAGFSTAEHFMFNASIQKENFFGYGIGGSISTQLSRLQQLFMLSVNDPYFLDTSWMAGGSVYRSSYSFNDFRRTSTGGDLNFGHRFFDNFSANMGYQIEKVDASSFSYTVPDVFRQNASGLTSAVSLTIARDTRNNRIYPTKGMYNSVIQEASGKKLGGDNDFYRINFRTMFYQPVWKTIIFKQFFRIGYIDSLNDEVVPLFERFFLGGPNSLRGFYPNSVGPVLRIPASPSGPEANFTYGGDKILLFVSELELPIFDKAGLRAVGFFDAGNAYAESQAMSLPSMRADYGFGLRWNSPMGPLRFEFGFPINRQAGEDSMVFNFTIGNFF